MFHQMKTWTNRRLNTVRLLYVRSDVIIELCCLQSEMDSEEERITIQSVNC
ncbi:hypothetical protein DPMN_071814 [Dreissena polymorpha]|uniref:Uncharacterized protein n=1 Tax=Dreissena polymorpha TaxID=45954 RepID=A0A9D4BW98_DREPO|nr:hypothetical protein DPMN_071426 [Dreissena polymorpha]KAH3712135.1 hypothetical protein DPMN_071814 [Dreissena polymorpha]